MESTITQNSSLYLAQHRGLKRRTGLFLHPRATAKKNRITDALRKNGRQNPIFPLGLVLAKLDHRN